MATVFLYLALVIAFFRTAEAMGRFGPATIMGLTDPAIPVLWGMGAALLVEGVIAYAYHALIAPRVQSRRGLLAIGGMAVAFSLVFNFIDVGVNQGWFNINQTGAFYLTVQFIVTALPVAVAGAFMAMRIFASPTSGGGGQSRPQMGGGGMPNMSNHNMRSEVQFRPQRPPTPSFDEDDEAEPTSQMARPTYPAPSNLGEAHAARLRGQPAMPEAVRPSSPPARNGGAPTVPSR